MRDCLNTNVFFTFRRSVTRMRLFRNSFSLAAAVWLVAILAANAQTPRPAAKAFTPSKVADGQPEIPNGVWNRRGVGGLDNGALEAQDHRPPNPLDPTPANPLSVSSRDDGLNNVDRGFFDQFSEKLGKIPQQGQRGQNRERRQMGRSEERRVGKGWRRRGRRGQYKK